MTIIIRTKEKQQLPKSVNWKPRKTIYEKSKTRAKFCEKSNNMNTLQG